MDIRQRRGVRGSKYAFVNSKRLQQVLKDLSVDYHHIIDLAPTSDIRDLQKKDDIINGEMKRDRQVLGRVFRLEYENRILDSFQFDDLVQMLIEKKAQRIVLFCVEESHHACHRSVVADRLMKKYNYKITHL